MGACRVVVVGVSALLLCRPVESVIRMGSVRGVQKGKGDGGNPVLANFKMVRYVGL